LGNVCAHRTVARRFDEIARSGVLTCEPSPGVGRRIDRLRRTLAGAPRQFTSAKSGATSHRLINLHDSSRTKPSENDVALLPSR
jgi:hypothetical protein